MIDFNNAESIDRAAKEFVSSHDLLKVDFSGYRKCQIGDDNDIAKHPGMKELIDKDKYGEYLGSFYNQLKREKSLYKEHSVYAFFDDDFRVMAIASYQSAKSYAAEFFEYYENYYVGLMFVSIGWSNDESNYMIGRVTYYICDEGKVTRMITAHDCSSIKKSRIDNIELSYESDIAVIKNSTASVYKMLKSGFELDKQWDLFNLPVKVSSNSKKRIDNQKKLCSVLKKRIKNITSLEKAVDLFFETVSEAKSNDEEMLLFEVGCYSFEKEE